jgi:hypothetical protein
VLKGISGAVGRGLWYLARLYEWASGQRAYRWSSSPPLVLFAKMANRFGGWPSAPFRAAYMLACAVLKFRERLYLERANFATHLGRPVNARTLRNVLLWQREIALGLPATQRAHLNLNVADGETAQVDRVLSVLLLSERVGNVSFFFDPAAALAARSSVSTVHEERRGLHGIPFDLDGTPAAEAGGEAGWERILSPCTAFDANVNHYLKLAHPGKLVVALGLPESEDGFCDPELASWREALDAAQWPSDVTFVVLNAVGPQTLRGHASGRGPLTFARAAGLSLGETLRLAQTCDVFVGGMDVYGQAARAGGRPGVYDAHAQAPTQACERLQHLLWGLRDAEPQANIEDR